jgi:hypothetical protein
MRPFNGFHQFCFRMAGNATYVIGSLAETALGCSRIVRICTASSEEESSEVLKSLTSLLDVANTDLETVLNAAGTLGTLVSCTPFIYISNNGPFPN